MNIKKLALFIILVVFTFFISCSDDPNSVGSALIPEDDKLATFLIDSQVEDFEQSFTSFQKDSVFFGSSDRILLGNYENISSKILISFLIDIPDSIQEGLDANYIHLTSSWIEFYPYFWLGDSSSFKFSAHKIGIHWQPINLTQDSIRNIENSVGPDIITSYSYSPGDTVIKFSIDQKLVNDWVHASYDDSYPANNGLLLDPISNTGIAGFQALSTFPIYNYPNLFLEFTEEGIFTDTIVAVPKLDIHLPSGEKKIDQANSIILQGGINVRGKLKFNLDTVPRDIIVNKALLDLYYDEANSFEGNYKTDTIAVSMLYSANSDSIYVKFGKYPIKRSSGVYSGNVTTFIQRWLDGVSDDGTEVKNEGFEVKLTDENRNAAAISIYGSNNPDKSLRPRLKIYYTKK